MQFSATITKLTLASFLLVSTSCRVSSPEDLSSNPDSKDEDQKTNDTQDSFQLPEISCKAGESLENTLRVAEQNTPLSDCGLKFNTSANSMDLVISNKSAFEMILESSSFEENLVPNFKIDTKFPITIPGKSQTTVSLKFTGDLKKEFEGELSLVFAYKKSSASYARVYARIKAFWSFKKEEKTNPKITAVKVSGSQWHQDFKKFIDAGNPHSETQGYLIPTGRKQLAPLPWINLDQIFVTFTEDVGESLSLEDFSLQVDKGLVPDGNQNLVPARDVKIRDLKFHKESKTAQLFLDDFADTSVITLSIKSEGVFNSNGNRLFGKWVNGESTSSGEDGLEGNFNYQIRVLAGDVNQDYYVDKQDQDLVLPTLILGVSPSYSVILDVNGDRAVTYEDRPQVRNREKSKLVFKGPKITDIRVGSSAWVSQFKNHIDPNNSNAALRAYIVPKGSDQLKPLPWNNINQISITFSEDVGESLELRDFSIKQQMGSLVGLDAKPSQIDSFSYDKATKTATIYLNKNLEVSKLTLIIKSIDVSDSLGRQLLGQWINGVSTESGSNNLLDDFEFTTNHLPGDVNQDLSVDTVDQNLLIANLMLGVTPEYTIFKDFDGNQAVSLLERVALHPLKGSKLP